MRLTGPLFSPAALLAVSGPGPDAPASTADHLAGLVPACVVAVLLLIGIILFCRRAFRCATCGKQTRLWRHFTASEKQAVAPLIPDVRNPLLALPDIRVCPSCGTIAERAGASASTHASLPHANVISTQYKAWGNYLRTQNGRKR